MACPTTRAKNTSQHPGQVILDTVQKRHTSEQKQADNAQAELVKQEQAAAREQGFKWIAEIIDCNEQEQGDILANPPQPRPRLVLKAPHAQLQMDKEEGGEAVEAENADADEDKPEEEGSQDESDGELTQKTSRRKRMWKTLTREAIQIAQGMHESNHDRTDRGNSEPEKGNLSVSAVFLSPSRMLLLTETILFYWDSIDYHYRQDSQAAKGEFAGITDWADKLSSLKSLRTVLGSQRSTATHYTKTTKSVSTSTRTPHITPASTNVSTRTSTPTPSTISTDMLEDYIDGTDEAKCKLLPGRPHNTAVT